MGGQAEAAGLSLASVSSFDERLFPGYKHTTTLKGASKVNMGSIHQKAQCRTLYFRMKRNPNPKTKPRTKGIGKGKGIGKKGGETERKRKRWEETKGGRKKGKRGEGESAK